MRKSLTTVLLCAGLGYATTGVHAQTPITGCPKDFQTAAVNVTALVSTNLTGCPLLLDKRLRNLINKFGAGGTVFAYPDPELFPCLSGTVNGRVSMPNKTFNVTGSTESAQRFFPEALAVNPSGYGVFLTGLSDSDIRFASGAAMTVVSLKDISQNFTLDLVLSDRFTINLSAQPFVDNEDFDVVGTDKAAAVGRLTGVAEIYGNPFLPLTDVEFNINGKICLKL